MSVSLIKGRGWRYDFVLKGKRYTSTYYKTKSEAREAEVERREEIKNPKPEIQAPTDMGFLELVNKRLDYVSVYNSEKHYENYKCLAKKWIKKWKKVNCSEISPDMIQNFVIDRARVSEFTANKEIRYLKATFNFGLKRNWISNNPVQGISFLPVEKKVKYVPPKDDVLKVILAADPETQDYLWTIIHTMARMSEINQLKWEDVNFNERYIILYTRKKKGSNRTPRKVPMTKKLFEVLYYRFNNRDKSKPWVFCHRYWSRKRKKWVEGPYKDRKRIMITLCKRAGVKYFRYHALRHLGASILDKAKVNIGAIQRMLGHENRSTTEIYLHSIGEAEREAIKVFDDTYEKSHPNSHPDKKMELTLTS